MSERPIIFSGPMVLALLDGRKSMTRRLATSPLRKCAAGDQLWVRESYSGSDPVPAYKADNPNSDGWGWRPSIHMPRWASRLTLTVTGVKIERLQEITEEDAIAEGISWSDVYEGFHTEECRHYHASDPVKAFEKLWWSIHGAGAWDANPEVVAIGFTVEHRNIDAPALELANA